MRELVGCLLETEFGDTFQPASKDEVLRRKVEGMEHRKKIHQREIAKLPELKGIFDSINNQDSVVKILAKAVTISDRAYSGVEHTTVLFDTVFDLAADIYVDAEDLHISVGFDNTTKFFEDVRKAFRGWGLVNWNNSKDVAWVSRMKRHND
jgi:hypothetical protein